MEMYVGSDCISSNFVFPGVDATSATFVGRIGTLNIDA